VAFHPFVATSLPDKESGRACSSFPIASVTWAGTVLMAGKESACRRAANRANKTGLE
jgi:hypothetical protein